VTPATRCSTDSAAREESLVGTASTVRSFLLVEAPGSWGVDAARDNRLPERVRRHLTRAAASSGVRVLIIRRHGRTAPCDLRVIAAYADAERPWLESACLPSVEELLDVDLAGLGAGRSAGLPRQEDPVFLVCTHGRHDVCCAERGRPVAAALHRELPDHTWEVSHIGGDRFAGNVLVLPTGLYYGRLSPAGAVELARRHLDGHLDLEHLRGRCAYPFPVQAAETFLRREIGRTELAGLMLRRSRRMPDQRSNAAAHVTEAELTDGRSSWVVRVRTTMSPPHQLTCRAIAASPAPEHTLIDIRRQS
jgi:hypothetical protein